jgi:hypothetical protein
MSKSPTPWRADRDLDGDRTLEIVVADRTLCTAQGNCHWNLFRREGDCQRYLGTISAAAIQRTPQRGEDGFFGLRTWWHFTGGGRMLMQEYAFRRGGYRLIEALLCRQEGDDRVLCEEQGR